MFLNEIKLDPLLRSSCYYIGHKSVYSNVFDKTLKLHDIPLGPGTTAINHNIFDLPIVDGAVLQTGNIHNILVAPFVCATVVVVLQTAS